jgi:hypothetical protein
MVPINGIIVEADLREFPRFCQLHAILTYANSIGGNPRGWDTMSFRIIAAGAGMLAAFTLAASATAAAQTIGSKPSASSSQTSAARPLHRATRPLREAARARHSRRSRIATRHHHRASEATAESIRRPMARVESLAAVHQQTTAERRFREFLSPRDFAVVSNQELRSPRLSAALFSGQMADPQTVLASTTEPVAADPPTGAPPIVASDPATPDDSANKVVAPAQRDPVQVRRADPTEKQPDRMSFLGWFFVAWGGVLTFASAVRMAMS